MQVDENKNVPTKLEFGERKKTGQRLEMGQERLKYSKNRKPPYSSRRIAWCRVVIIDVVEVLIICWMITAFFGLPELTDVSEQRMQFRVKVSSRGSLLEYETQ